MLKSDPKPKERAYSNNFCLEKIARNTLSREISLQSHRLINISFVGRVGVGPCADFCDILLLCNKDCIELFLTNIQQQFMSERHRSRTQTGTVPKTTVPRVRKRVWGLGFAHHLISRFVKPRQTLAKKTEPSVVSSRPSFSACLCPVPF